MRHRDGRGGDEHAAEQTQIAPVAYLPGVVRSSKPDAASRATVAFRDGYWSEDEASSGVADVAEVELEPVDRETIVADAAVALTRSLGRRGLSVSEATARLRAAGLTPDESAGVIDEHVERGWLDDDALAEQLVYSATTRKSMGTRAVRQLLVKRLIARDVIDRVAAELPDDDAERALEFARTKARSLVRYDDQTAMRRLTGALARRGFGGSVASTAARTALADERRGQASSGVRFH